MENCVFCKIARGDLPCASLKESKRIICFLDIHPVNKGHALVVPKSHVQNLLDADPEDLKEAVMTVQEVARACMKATGAEGFNVLQNNGRCAGQVVGHVHFHVIPRSPEDGFALGWRQGKYEGDEMETLRLKIAENICCSKR